MRGGLPFEFCLSCPLPRRIPAEIPGRKEENNEVQHRRHNGDSCKQVSCNNGIQNHHSVHNPHPLHLDRNNEIEKHLHIRVGDRKGKEYTHVNVGNTEQTSHSGKDQRASVCQIRSVHCVQGSIQDKCSDHRKQEPGKNVDIITESSPCTLQRISQRIIQHDHKHEKKQIFTRCDKNPAYDPPHLPP